MSNAQPWLATSVGESSSEVALWRCSPSSPAWWIEGRVAVPDGVQRLRGQSVWLPETSAPTGRSPLLVFGTAEGLVLTRW